MRVRRGEALASEDFATDISIVRDLVTRRGVTEMHEPGPLHPGSTKWGYKEPSADCRKPDMLHWGETVAGTHCAAGTTCSTPSCRPP